MPHSLLTFHLSHPFQNLFPGNTESGGNFLDIAWVANYDNLAAVEEANGKMLADPRFIEKIATGGELFQAGGNNQDRMWREA